MDKNKGAKYQSYSEFFRGMAEMYGDMSYSGVKSAYERAISGFSRGFTLNPMIQNRRVKGISSLPADFGKDRIAEMLQNPLENEQNLRQVSGILEYTAYPMYKLRTTYQNLMTYHWYVYPQFIEKKEKELGDKFMREWKMVTKFAQELQPSVNCRKIVGQAVRDGKVFYYPRIDVDKSHNSVKGAVMQQLPQDWIKIVGFNSTSRYTVAFNMFYFLKPGTSYTQFGDLFVPFVDDFTGVFEQKPKRGPKGVIYASMDGVSTAKCLKMQERIRGGEFEEDIEVTFENGRWYYWVYLPADKIWSFEIDDVKPAVVSPFTGLFLSMEQIAQYEQVQLEIVQNPLVSMVLGQLETYDAVSPTNADPIKVSPDGRVFFENLFYETMAQNNTGGVGIYSAPFKDMRLVQLSEAPNANQISSAGYEYAMEKSGMSALIPTNSEARAGVAQISLMLESQFARHIYWQFERMMNVLLENMGTEYDWKFHMFGSLAEDEKLMKIATEGMQRGMLPDILTYNALLDRSILDDMSMSKMIMDLGIMEMRLPMITSYSASNQNPNLPPMDDHVTNPDKKPVGRPGNDGTMPSSGGQEQDADNGTIV